MLVGYEVTKNEAILIYRKKKDTVEIEQIYEIEDKDNEINKVIDKMQYNRLISKLNDKEKEIVSLKIISGLSFEEISKLLSEPVGTIKWRYYKSINTLKLMLSNLAMFMITFVIGLKTLKRTITEDIKNKQEAIIENNTENNREIFTDEDTKKENSDVIQNSINKEKEESTEALKEEIIVQETTNYSNYNYYSVGLLGVSSIFLMLTIIFSSILVKHQLKLKKKTSK